MPWAVTLVEESGPFDRQRHVPFLPFMTGEPAGVAAIESVVQDNSKCPADELLRQGVGIAWIPGASEDERDEVPLSDAVAAVGKNKYDPEPGTDEPMPRPPRLEKDPLHVHNRPSLPQTWDELRSVLVHADELDAARTGPPVAVPRRPMAAAARDLEHATGQHDRDANTAARGHSHGYNPSIILARATSKTVACLDHNERVCQ